MSTEHPVWITHISGHLGSGNSKALALANITRATPQPLGDGLAKIRQPENPTARSKKAADWVTRHIPAHSQQEVVEAIRWAGRHYI